MPVPVPVPVLVPVLCQCRCNAGAVSVHVPVPVPVQCRCMCMCQCRCQCPGQVLDGIKIPKNFAGQREPLRARHDQWDEARPEVEEAIWINIEDPPPGFSVVGKASPKSRKPITLQPRTRTPKA